MSKKIKRTVCLLLLVVAAFCACYFGGVTYSYYQSHKTGAGTNTLQIAKFSLSATGDSIDQGKTVTVDISANRNNQTYSYTVKSESQVAVTYDAILTLPEPLPTGVKLFFEGKEYTISDDKLVYTCKNVGSFEAGGGEKTHTLTFKTDNTTVFAKLNHISLEIHATQANPS